MSSAHHRVVSLLLLGLAVAGCQDPLVSPDDTSGVPQPQFAQGDGGVWTVNSLDDPGDGTCDEAECTLREAIDAAGGSGAIVFAANLQGVINLQNAQLDIIYQGITIDGDGRITVDAQGASRAFYVSNLEGLHLLTLKNLTITNGNPSAGEGGGILIDFSSAVRLEGVQVMNNFASLSGGGISIGTGAKVSLVNTTVHENISGGGGGIDNSGELTIVTSTISRNIANGNGGGIRTTGEGTLLLEGSTISGNEAFGGLSRGGGIFHSGTVIIRNSTIARNHATNDAGGLIDEGGTASLASSIIAGNTDGVEPVPDDCDGDYVSLGHNVTTEGCDPGSEDVVILGIQAFSDVLEEELKDNGGPTRTHALIVRGRAVDVGYCPGATTDQRGLPRPVDDPVMANAVDACDAGAYELQGPFVARTDLMVSQSADKTSVKQGDLLTYTVRVRNLGPETAPNAILTNVLSSGVTFVSAVSAKGNFTAPPAGETGTVTWYLGDLLDQANETAEIRVTVRIKGRTTITNQATVTSDAVDPNPANNTASLATSVASGGTKPPGKGK
jgi:uncharacterized repeat protein (TIGR01451 family)/CSLREA domain-containing protein